MVQWESGFTDWIPWRQSTREQAWASGLLRKFVSSLLLNMLSGMDSNYF